MENDLSREDKQELAQRLYQEVQAGTPVPEAIARIQQIVKVQRGFTAEQLLLVVSTAATQAFQNQQLEIEDALLQALGDENWDVNTYEIMVGRLCNTGRFVEAWTLLKKCEKELSITFSSFKKMKTCMEASETKAGQQILESMLQVDPTDDVARAFVFLGKASEMQATGKQEDAENTVNQIFLDDSSLHLRFGREMICRGFIEQGSRLAATATGETRGAFIGVGNELFTQGHPREAAAVIEPVITLGVVRNAGATSLGFELDALNLLAKCAKQDPIVEERFLQEIERLRKTEQLPDEYIERLFFTHRTGMAFDKSKYAKIAKHYGKGNFMRVREATKRKLSEIPVHDGQVTSNDLPELDGTGEGKTIFCSMMERGDIAKALTYFSNFRGKVPAHTIRVYDRNIYAALSTGNYPMELWDSVLTADPANREVFVLATKRLLIANKIEDAMALFGKRHGGLLKNGRAFGQQLFETGKRGNALPSRAAAMVLDDGYPKVALEIIKPILLNFISTNDPIPLHVLEVFARCAALDGEIQTEFLEQMRDYRKHRRVAAHTIDGLLRMVFGDEYKDDKKNNERGKTALPNGGNENEDEYIGRVSRSRFFQDPHAMLRAKPIDKTASLVTGKKQTPKKRGS